ncbi:MAG: NAD(P)-dependent oxidoreductase [Rhizobiales bacterium]|nr:NAD(P)-dependent oxidoreductase [Hyphomicrobiales bacterium]
MERIAVLGLGIMGGGMAVNWLRKGYPTAVWNRTRAKAEALTAEGAIVAATPAAAAADADVIVAMVADDAASREVWLGSDGALAAAQPGALIVDSSTVTPNWIRELAAKAAERGCGFVDAPVGGSKQAAAEGQLVIFAGAEPEVFEKLRPVLGAVARVINHVGPVGAGATWKLINNMMVAIQISSLAEAMAMVARAGFDAKQVAGLIEASGFASGVIRGKLPRMMDHDYAAPDFNLSLMLKDTRYAVDMARTLGVDLKLAPAAAELFAAAERQGLGGGDVAGVAESVGAPAGGR